MSADGIDRTGSPVPRSPSSSADPPNALLQGRRMVKELAGLPPSYYLLAVVLLTTAAAAPQLLSTRALLIFLRQAAPLGVAVLGQMVVMRARSIDLSIGGVFVLTNYLVTSGMLRGEPIALLIVVPLLLGLVVGIINGMLVAVVRASAVIVTLGMTTVLTGLVLLLSSGRPPGAVPVNLKLLSAWRILNVPLPVLVWIVLAALVALALRFLVFGRFLTAAGDNPRAAIITGLPLPRIVVTTHVLSGLSAAAGGILYTAALGVGSVRFGPEIVMNSIAAAILGGSTFGGGRGGVAGPFIAVVALTFMFAVLTVFGFQEPGKLMTQGIVIAAAAIAYGIRSR
jgi:ribose transport system permease protein